MANAARTGYIAECYWAGVREPELDELDRRIEATVTEASSGRGAPVRYLGWLLVHDDDVVLVLFEGPVATVRHVAEHAEVPFERLLKVSYPPRPNPIADEEVPD